MKSEPDKTRSGVEHPIETCIEFWRLEQEKNEAAKRDEDGSPHIARWCEDCKLAQAIYAAAHAELTALKKGPVLVATIEKVLVERADVCFLIGFLADLIAKFPSVPKLRDVHVALRCSFDENENARAAIGLPRLANYGGGEHE